MLHWCHHHHTNNSRLLHDHSSQKRQSTKLKLSWPPWAILMPHNIMSSNFPFCLSILFIYLLVLLSFSFSFSLFSLVISPSLMFLSVLSPPVSHCLMTETLHIWVQSKHVCDCLYYWKLLLSVFNYSSLLLSVFPVFPVDWCTIRFWHLYNLIPSPPNFNSCKGWKSCECLWRDSHGCDVVCVKHMKLSHTHTHEWMFFFLSCEQIIYIAVEELHPTPHLSLHVQEQNQSIVFFAGSCGS
jgi:hypothetical protein